MRYSAKWCVVTELQIDAKIAGKVDFMHTHYLDSPLPGLKG
jgi:hypothetical protein